MGRYMWATTAEHRGNDVSRPEGDICRIVNEEIDHWIGAWVSGFGLFNVRFPKETTRLLSRIEIEYYEGKAVLINGKHFQTLRLA